MARRRKTALSRQRLQSAITNGKHLLANVDHRGAEMRRLADCVHAHVSDLGGESNISHSERVLASRASMLTLLAEMYEQKFVQQQMKVRDGDIVIYTRLVSTLRRTMSAIGLKRRAKDVTTPSLVDVLAAYNRDEAADEVGE